MVFGGTRNHCTVVPGTRAVPGTTSDCREVTGVRSASILEETGNEEDVHGTDDFQIYGYDT
jgi:hypothetical protein